MRDGVALAADVYRPPSGRVPAIVLRTPYDRRELRDRVVELDPLLAVREGFAFVIQDLRGRHASGGEFVALLPDVEDGADTVAWIRRQPWSDGRVMMAGSSYDGCVQFQAARARPEGLVAIAPTMSGSLRTIWYPGGALRLAGIAGWITRLLVEALAGRRLRPAERAELETLLDASALERVHALLDADSLAGRVGVPLRHWVAREASDAYWTETTAVTDEPLPAIFTTGAYDVCLQATTEAYAACSTRADGLRPQLLTIGPWAHDLLDAVYPDLGLHAGATPHPLIAQRRQIAFFKSVLAGAPARDLAPVASFVLGRNRWHEDVRWPPPGTRRVELALGVAEGGAGTLTRATAPERSAVRYRHDPRDPVPTHGGAHGVWHVVGPLDQRAIEAREDVLTFTSASFAGELELAGAPLATLVVASSAPAADFVLKLALVLPDGRSLPIANGNWSGRLGDLPHAQGERPLRRCEVELGPLHVALAPGWRLRLQIASSSYPDLYPNPSTGHDLRDGPPPRVAVAEQTVLVGAGGSRVVLPVRGTFPREADA